MKITPADHGLDLGKAAPGYVRSPGRHMSDLYNSLYEKLEPKRYSKSDGLPWDKIEMGLAFEELLEDGLRRRVSLKESDGQTVERPGEFFTNDYEIAYSPDLLIYNGETILGEIKLTWMSTKGIPITREQAEAAGRPDLENTVAKDFPPKFDKWFTQMMAYCYHLKLTKARLIVMFVNGNYKPMSPVPLAWNITFSARELQENWQMLLNHGKHEGLI